MAKFTKILILLTAILFAGPALALGEECQDDGNGHVTCPGAPDDLAKCSRFAMLANDAVKRCEQALNAADATCTQVRKKAQLEINQKLEKIKKDLDEKGSSFNAACEQAQELDDKVKTPAINEAARKCKIVYDTTGVEKCTDLAKQVNDTAARENVNLQFCDANSNDYKTQSNALVKLIEQGSQASAKIEEISHKELKVVALQSKNLNQCAKDTCASGDEDCKKKDDEEKNRDVAGDRDTEDDGKKKDNTTSNIAKMAGPAMAALPMLANLFNNANNQQPAAQMALPAVAELPNSSCMRPEMAGSSECRCFMTGDCRNGEVAGQVTFGAMPGSGGAALDNPNSGGGIDLGSPGGVAFPAMANNNNGGGGGGGGGGGFVGGGGMMGGGGGAATKSAEAPAGRARSSLSADILQGVRGGNSMGAAGLGGRTQPGLGAGLSDSPSAALLKNPHPDLKQFMPNLEEQPKAGPAAVAVSGGSGLKGPVMHPANANFFKEITRTYRALDATFIP